MFTNESQSYSTEDCLITNDYRISKFIPSCIAVRECKIVTIAGDPCITASSAENCYWYILLSLEMFLRLNQAL